MHAGIECPVHEDPAACGLVYMTQDLPRVKIIGGKVAEPTPRGLLRPVGPGSRSFLCRVVDSVATEGTSRTCRRCNDKEGDQTGIHR